LSHVSTFPRSLLIFVALVVLAELATSEAFMPQVLFSISSAVYFASLLLYGPMAAVLVAMVGGLVITLVAHTRQERASRAPLLQRASFNTAAFGLSVFVAGVVYVFFGGQVGEVARLSNLVPLALAAAVDETLNVALVIGVVSLQTGRPAFQIWRENVSWAMPMKILTMVVGGGVLALGYKIAGVLGAGAFFLPLAMTIYAFQLYVRQTKTQMARQEEIIAERTQELQTAFERLKRQDQAKTRFFSVINHEMRTPLTAILGFTEIMLVHGSRTSDDAHMLNIVKDNTRRLMGLVNNILDMARIEDGQMTVLPEVVQVSSAIEQAISVVRPMAEEKAISIEVDVYPDMPDVRADPRRLHQILINLLDNAIKYTPDTGKVTISTRSSIITDQVLIGVTDTGIGIPASELPFVFDRFSRVERAETNQAVGTGLGLFIVKGLVEAHGGEMFVESEEGHGSCFALTLPMAAEALPKASPQEQLGLERLTFS
jgi:signal transduction histidine kinase